MHLAKEASYTLVTIWEYLSKTEVSDFTLISSCFKPLNFGLIRNNK